MVTKGKSRDFTKDPMVQAYFAKLREWHGYVRFLGMPHLKDNPDLRIERLFVQPRLSERSIDPADPPEKWSDTVSVMEALDKHRYLVVLGDPGGGKSTLISWLAWRFSHPGDHAWTRRFGRLIPVTLVLRDMDLSGVESWESLLDSGLAQTVMGPLNTDAGRALIHDAAAAGQVLFLLDGLDEVSDVKTRERIRDATGQCRAHYPDCLLVATSRIVGYEEAPFDVAMSDAALFSAGMLFGMATAYLQAKSREAAGERAKEVLEDRTKLSNEESRALLDRVFGPKETMALMETTTAHRLYVAPFDDKQIEAFSTNWHLERETVRERAEDNAGAFVAAVREHAAVSALSRNPNLLTMMALIHKRVAKLPDGRLELYDRITEAYLETIDATRNLDAPDYPYRKKRKWLARVGFEMQRRRASVEAEAHKKPREKAPDILASLSDVTGWIAEAMARDGVGDSDAAAAGLVDHIARRSGLLIPRAEGQFAFAHLSFQEYFAAHYLADAFIRSPASQTKDPIAGTHKEDLSKYARDAVWREAMILFFERVAQEDWTDDALDAVFGADFDDIEPEDDPAIHLLLRLAWDSHAGLTDTHIDVGFGRLTSLMVSGARIRDFRPFIAARRLKLLAVYSCEIADGGFFSCLADRALDSLTLFNTTCLDYAPIASLGSLTDFSGNALDFARMDVLSGLTNLQSLDLSHTKVSDFGPLSGLTNLRSLNLMYTQVNDVAALSGLTNLRSLDLSYTQVSDVGPLSGLANLSSLKLTHTQVSDVAALSGLTNLQSLDLGNSQVSGVGALLGLTNLKSLSLWNTLVSDICALSGLTNLQSLHLDGTQVNDVEALSGLTNLQSLFLNGTQVNDVEALSGLTNLQSLHLNGTQVNDVETLSGLTNLKSLDLNNTQVSDIWALSGLTNLQKLNLMRTQVSDVGALSGLTNLKSLDLDGNRVSDVDALSGLTNLGSLDLRNTKVSDVSALSDLLSRGLQIRLPEGVKDPLENR